MPAVDLLMVPQVGEGPEGFAALRTHVWPLAGVRSAVFGQMHALDETFSAHFTAERPLARVGAQVLSQVGVLSEALTAYLAREGALAGVNSLVERDPRGRHKLFAADGTLVGFRPLR